MIERGDIADLIGNGLFEEGLELEAKQARTSFPRSAWETVSAFANTVGGILVLGLAPGNEPLEWRVEGVENPEAIAQDIRNALRNRQKINIDVTRSSDIWIEPCQAKRLVVVRILPATRSQKPVFLNSDPDAAWIRRGDGDMRCTPDELARMRRESSSRSADAEVLPEYTLDDIDWETVEAYQHASADSRPDLPHHGRTGRAYLESIGAWRRDREQDRDGPTLAGIMMFGTEAAVQSARLDHMIDYQRIPFNATPKRRWSHRIQWSGNLFQAWLLIFPRLVRGLDVSFKLEGPRRVDRPDGLDSLREAFVNLLVHTDYSERRDAVIRHQDDGYIFRNPGASWVDVRYLGVEGRSERRNPEIAKMFDLAGLADRAGSGFIRIQDEWKTLGYRRPKVLSDPDRFEFLLELSLAILIPTDDRRWLQSIGESWRDEEELALWLARHNGMVDNQTLREISGQHMGDASRTLVSLKNRGYLVSRGAGRGVYYLLGVESLLMGEPERTDTERKAPEGEHKLSEGEHKAREGEHRNRPLAYLHRESLHRVIMPLRDTRRAPSSTEMRETILQLCAIEPLSVEQLADLFQRAETTIRRYVQGLQRERRLKRAESMPGARVARYVTVPTMDARQQRLEIP